MELVVRAAVMYVVLFALVRMTGKRELAEMSSFEMVLLIVLGDVVQQAITQEDASITGALLTAGTLTLLVVLTGGAAYRWPKFRNAMEGVPIVIVRDGEVVHEAMRVERLTLDDVMSEARRHGIADLADVRICVLESDGRFSFVTDGTQNDDDDPSHRA